MKQYQHMLAAALAGFCLLTSCYRIISCFVPQQAEAGQTVAVSFTIVDDGDTNQKFVSNWSYAGVRVPDGWEVRVPTGAHQQFAEEWVYYEDGTKVNSSQDMMPCQRLTQFYNSACAKNGYTWHAFQSTKQVPKFVAACWRNGCDSIRVTFLVTIPENTPRGTYTIDFLGGDEEDARGVEKYTDLNATQDSRLFHVGTVSSSRVKHPNLTLSRTIEVLDRETAISLPLSRRLQHAQGIYSLDGKLLRRDGNPQGLPQGMYYINGRKTVVRKGGDIRAGQPSCPL